MRGLLKYRASTILIILYIAEQIPIHFPMLALSFTLPTCPSPSLR